MEGAGAEALGEAGAIRGTGGVLGAQPGWGSTAGGDGAKPGLLLARPHHTEGTARRSRARGGGQPQQVGAGCPPPHRVQCPRVRTQGRKVAKEARPRNPRTKLPGAVAGVPLAVAEPAAPMLCHLLPGVVPAWALQLQWHRAGKESSAPGTAPSPPVPPYSQALQVREAQEGAVGGGCQGVLRQVPANTPGAAYPARGAGAGCGSCLEAGRAPRGGVTGDSGDGDQSVHGPAPSRGLPPEPSPCPARTHRTTTAAASANAAGRLRREQLLRSNLGQREGRETPAHPAPCCSPPHAAAPRPRRPRPYPSRRRGGPRATQQRPRGSAPALEAQYRATRDPFRSGPGQLPHT